MLPHRFFIVLVLICGGVPAYSQVLDSLSRFERIVVALEEAPEEWRADFAVVAVSHLAEAYRIEAELAREETEGDQLKLQRWSRSVDRFADQLFPLLIDAEQGLPVSLEFAAGEEVVLTVDERRVVLSHPRPDQQQRFEYEVAELFCLSVPCHRLLSAPVVVGSAVQSPGTVTPQWQFTEDSRICAYDGIRIVFPALVNVAAMRNTCTGLFREISEVLRQISRQVSQSVRVEWRYISLQSSMGGKQNLLQLNRAGDAIPLQTPMLSRHPAAFEALVPWFSAKMSGVEHPVELQSAQLQSNPG